MRRSGQRKFCLLLLDIEMFNCYAIIITVKTQITVGG